MTKYFVGTLLFLFSLSSHAQILPTGVELVKGTPFSLEKGQDITKFVHSDHEGTIAYSRTLNQISFLKFDADLNLTTIKIVKLQIEKNDLTFLRIEEAKNGINVFSYYYDESTFTTTLYQQLLTPSTLELTEPKEVYSKVTDELTGGTKFTLNVSPNLNYIGFVAAISEGSNDDNKISKHDYLLLNSNLEKIWEKTDVEVTESGTNFIRMGLEVGNNGLLTLMGMTFNSTSEESSTFFDLMQRHLVVVQDSLAPVIFNLKIEETRFLSLTSEISPSGDIIVVGNTYKKENNSYGFYYAKIDVKNGQFAFEKISDFGDMPGVLYGGSDPNDQQVQEVLKYLNNVRPGFVIKKLFIDETGATLVGESKVTSTNYDMKHNFYGAAIVRFDTSGNIIWRQGVPKIQSANPNLVDYCSYGIVKSENKISLFFNFLPVKETSGSLVGNTWMAKNASDLYLAQVDEGSQVTSDVILFGKKKPFYRPSKYFMLSDQSTIFLGSYGKNFQLCKIKVSPY